jgi:hypothetical protein
LIDHTGDVDNGMALKYGGQSIGQVACQAAAGPLVQFQVEAQALAFQRS